MASSIKEDPKTAAIVVRVAVNLIRLFAIAADPVIPFTSSKVFDALNLSDAERTATFAESSDLGCIRVGRAFAVPEHLFRRIDDSDIRTWKQRFGGHSHHKVGFMDVWFPVRDWRASQYAALVII